MSRNKPAGTDDRLRIRARRRAEQLVLERVYGPPSMVLLLELLTEAYLHGASDARTATVLADLEARALERDMHEPNRLLRKQAS